jgi:hypothetical protein
MVDNGIVPEFTYSSAAEMAQVLIVGSVVKNYVIKNISNFCKI